MEPLYVTPAGGMRLITYLLSALLLGMAVLGVVVAVAVSVVAAVSALVSLLAILLLLGVILPRRYEVWPERLRIVFPLRKWDIPLADIENVRAAHWLEAYAFWGLRFATAPSQAVTIFRHNANLFTHPNLVISPSDREEFLHQLRRAMGR